ncbi:MoaF-related domain-containing protein [Mucilaginibacter lappiensis]|uniref:Putative small secreted protein n=1 Tax=Mucilaginibacter lappiensis TaxID=354630 RepID=A0A841JIQ6_9SPHI|nr:MoaF N-terminal domain-containing protein [Mucilaginibacter lappiensis]MBB6130827.1 putative small secreted protein [Mucilaginibacter lappiensis]
MKKTIITYSGVLAIAIFLAACNGNNKTGNGSDTTTKSTVAASHENSINIIGKTGTVTFPQFSVDETFVSDTTLHWKIVDEKGGVTEGDEKVSFKKINDNQYFVNWIEKTGLTVSQILDSNKGTATAFVSRADEKSDRGKRSANFLEGSFKLKD